MLHIPFVFEFFLLPLPFKLVKNLPHNVVCFFSSMSSTRSSNVKWSFKSSSKCKTATCFTMKWFRALSSAIYWNFATGFVLEYSWLGGLLLLQDRTDCREGLDAGVLFWAEGDDVVIAVWSCSSSGRPLVTKAAFGLGVSINVDLLATRWEFVILRWVWVDFTRLMSPRLIVSSALSPSEYDLDLDSCVSRPGGCWLFPALEGKMALLWALTASI